MGAKLAQRVKKPALKIGFVLDDGLDTSDGVQQYVLTLGRWLSVQGHKVHYLVGETVRTDIPNVHSLGRNLNVRFNQNRLSIPFSADELHIKQLLEREKFDVLHVQMPFSPFLAKRILALAQSDTAIVGTFHVLPYSTFQSWATRALGFWLKPSLKSFDTVLSVSVPARTFARQAFGVESEVLPNVVDLKRFRNARPLPVYAGAKLTLLFLGRLVQRKGCSYLLQALDVLEQAGALDNVRVLICGKGPLEGKLKQYAAKYGLDKRMEFLGYIDEKDKPRYLASADIALFPSIGGESFGIVLLEAMAAGAGSILAGNNPGYRSVLENNPPLLVDPTDTVEFASRLQKLINNPGLRKQIHAWQAQVIEQYDVDSVGPRLVQCYVEAIAKHHVLKDNESDGS